MVRPGRPAISEAASGSGVAASGDGRTPEVTVITPPPEVRAKFQKIKPLSDLSVTQRGWTLDVLNIVRRLLEERGLSQTAARRQPDQQSNHPDRLSSIPALRVGTTRAPAEFTNEEVYTYAPELEKLHPCRAVASAKADRQLPHQR